MANISAPGIGSGLDINSILTQLMSLERRPIALMKNQQTVINNQISALGKMKSSLDAFNTASSELSKLSSVFTGTLSDPSVAKVSVGSSAASGTYSLEVEQLATNHKIQTGAGVDTSTGGKLTIELGGVDNGVFTPKDGSSQIEVDIEAGASLAEVRDAINATKSGVTATIVNGKDGPQLVVTSKESGESNQIKISAEGGLAGLDFDPATKTGGMAENKAAKNAIVKIDGIEVQGTTSNTITDAVSGVTLTLTKTTAGSPVELVVAQDSATMQAKVENFVKAYNDAVSTLKDLSKYDPAGKASGVLNGDSTVTSALAQMRGVLSKVPDELKGSEFETLSALGITSNMDGTLKLDSKVLQDAMDKNMDGVSKTLSAYGAAFEKVSKEINATDGLIANRSNGLSTQSKSLDVQMERMETRMTQVEARYRAQFTALDVLMSKMQTTSSYLSQQLANLPKYG